ncbi:MAG TPA: ArgE/DapE family deacylase, partial [Anaerolineae bacterium]|nr:ArgE/DapE family deacylase [Anaerolineae bacterium]
MSSLTPVEEAVLSEVDLRFDDTVEFLRQLVREPSVLGHECGAQDLVFARLSQMGLSPEMWDLDLEHLRTHPLFVDLSSEYPELTYNDRPNVTAVWPAAASGGRSLILNGHIDVVSPEPLSSWTHDPWSATVEGDWLYGRGAADMKSGIAAMLLAVEAIRAAGVELRGDLGLQSVIEEECGGNGTLACCLRGMTADAAVVTEPTGTMGAFEAVLGLLWFRVRTTGKAGHPAQAGSAVNAIEKTYVVIEALRRLEEQINADLQHLVYRELDHPLNLVVGTIEGGDWPSTVPAECEIECRISFEPGITISDAQDQVAHAVGAAADADPWLRDNPPVVEFFGVRAEPAVANRNGPLLRLLKSCHQRVFQKPLSLWPFTGSTDQRFFTNQVQAEAIAYGPSGEGFHGTEERVLIPSVRQTAEALALLIL